MIKRDNPIMQWFLPSVILKNYQTKKVALMHFYTNLMYEIKKEFEEKNIAMKSSEDMIKLKRDDKDWLDL